jgi:hypothetical protein
MNKFRNAFIFFSILLSQAGCLPLLDRSGKDDRYKEAEKLEGTAHFYLQEGETDSAVNCYRRSVSMLAVMDKKATKSNDSLYRRHISRDYSWIGWIYDSLYKRDTGITYHLQSLKWVCKGYEDLVNTAITNYNIGCDYKIMGDTIGQMSSKGQQLYKKAVKYALASCWEYDSAENRTHLALDAYGLASIIYRVLQDTNREKFYRIKYNQLYAVLHPGNYMNKLERQNSSTNRDGQKNNGYNKNTKSNTNSNPWSANSYRNNGNSTTTRTTVENGVETTTTIVNGVVVKKETKRIY